MTATATSTSRKECEGCFRRIKSGSLCLACLSWLTESERDRQRKTPVKCEPTKLDVQETRT